MSNWLREEQGEPPSAPYWLDEGRGDGSYPLTTSAVSAATGPDLFSPVTKSSRSARRPCLSPLPSRGAFFGSAGPCSLRSRRARPVPGDPGEAELLPAPRPRHALRSSSNDKAATRSGFSIGGGLNEWREVFLAAFMVTTGAALVEARMIEMPLDQALASNLVEGTTLGPDRLELSEAP